MTGVCHQCYRERQEDVPMVGDPDGYRGVSYLRDVPCARHGLKCCGYLMARGSSGYYWCHKCGRSRWPDVPCEGHMFMCAHGKNPDATIMDGAAGLPDNEPRLPPSPAEVAEMRAEIERLKQAAVDEAMQAATVANGLRVAVERLTRERDAALHMVDAALVLLESTRNAWLRNVEGRKP